MVLEAYREREAEDQRKIGGGGGRCVCYNLLVEESRTAPLLLLPRGRGGGDVAEEVVLRPYRKREAGDQRRWEGKRGGGSVRVYISLV